MQPSGSPAEQVEPPDEKLAFLLSKDVVTILGDFKTISGSHKSRKEDILG